MRSNAGANSSTDWSRRLPRLILSSLLLLVSSCKSQIRLPDAGSADDRIAPGLGQLGHEIFIRASETARPFPRDYCNAPTVAPLEDAPEPFLYKPFVGGFIGPVWTSQMDHSVPTYVPDGTISALGETLSASASGPGLAGGSLAYTSGGPQWHGPDVPIQSLLANGLWILAYHSPSLDSYIYYDGHDGHDFAVTGPALAAADGVVLFKGDYGNSLGLVVEVVHPQGYLTRYAHLASFDDALQVGSEILAGEPVGTIGGSAVIQGRVDPNKWGVHLHFSVFRWADADRRWLITDPFGWDPWAGESAEEAEQAQTRDPLRSCNGEVSYNLWGDRWPRGKGESPEEPQRPTRDTYVGGWFEVPGAAQEQQGGVPSVSLLGLWEGETSANVDGHRESRTARFEIRDDCPSTEICLYVLAVPEPALHPPIVSAYDGYFCFGDDIDTYCFTPLDANTLEYFGHGMLGGENAILQRAKESTGTALRGQIAYRSGPPGSSTEIKLLDLATGHASVLVESHCDYSCSLSWSPDGTQLAYVEWVQDDQGKLAPQVVVLEVATGKKTVVVQPKKTAFVLLNNYWGYDEVHWSPDGEWVFYLAGDGRASGDELRVVPIQGGQSRTVQKPGGSFDFDLSTNGVILIREWFNGYDGHGLFLARPDGTVYQTLIDPKRQLTLCCVEWSPDAHTIAFSAPTKFLEPNILWPLHVWITSAVEIDPMQITFDDRYSETVIDWSPDGNWLVVLRAPVEVGSKIELRLVSRDGKTQLNLAEIAGDNLGQAAWRP